MFWYFTLYDVYICYVVKGRLGRKLPAVSDALMASIAVDIPTIKSKLFIGLSKQVINPTGNVLFIFLEVYIPPSLCVAAQKEQTTFSTITEAE